MPRIRTIKPTFWTDEKIGMLPREARYTFLGLISAMADDEGRLSGNPRVVRHAVYPFDDDITAADVESHLRQLAEAERIVRYRVNGDDYIVIRHWEHQKIDRPSASLLPPPPTDPPNAVRRTFDECSTSVRAGEESSVVEGKGVQLPPPRARTVDAETAALTAAFPRLAEAVPPDDAGRDVVLELATWAPDKRAYLAECVAALDGMHGFLLKPHELRQAITDWLANGERPNLRRFRGYLKGVKPLRGKTSDGDSPNARRAPADTGGDAALVLTQIKALAESFDTPGSGRKQIIRRAKVAALGPDVLRAYEAVGGSERILTAKPEHWGLLTRDFAAALSAAGAAA